MKTISLLILIITLLMWIIRYNQFKNKKIVKFNPFEDRNSFYADLIIFLTIWSILIILLGGLQYLT